MNKDLVSSKTITIDTNGQRVWWALTDRETIKKYFFGTEAISDWKAGSTLIFQGEWEGKTYKDKGHILAAEPGKLLQYNYWSGFSGLEDREENYSLVTYRLESTGNITTLSLTQQGFPSKEAKAHADSGWAVVLENLKKLLEKGE
jgi:uncharacterized protein YndB with AHSA1/START domain